MTVPLPDAPSELEAAPDPLDPWSADDPPVVQPPGPPPGPPVEPLPDLPTAPALGDTFDTTQEA